MSNEPTYLPRDLIEDVDRWVVKRLSDAAKYDNTEPLDENGVFTLHRLAASIYASAYAEGVAHEAARQWNRRSRERDAARLADTTEGER